ncbi:hypothetical protein EDB92DRAFT_1854458, partial [Lactarius akahatsu]
MQLRACTTGVLIAVLLHRGGGAKEGKGRARKRGEEENCLRSRSPGELCSRSRRGAERGYYVTGRVGCGMECTSLNDVGARSDARRRCFGRPSLARTGVDGVIGQHDCGDQQLGNVKWIMRDWRSRAV